LCKIKINELKREKTLDNGEKMEYNIVEKVFEVDSANNWQ